MKLHVFNPEHDMALAYHQPYITLPHAIQEFKNNLSFIPALWASSGDGVLVEDVAYAVKALHRLGCPHADVLFVTSEALRSMLFSGVSAWGMDKSLCTMLTDAGLDARLLPTDGQLEQLRRLSGRATSMQLLRKLRQGVEQATVGESHVVTDMPSVKTLGALYGNMVVKAPWSSSGRGIRYISAPVCPSVMGWIANIIRNQGYVMVEPYYKKVRDFAMEFNVGNDGQVAYQGLSLFTTAKGAYHGNLLATEHDKEEIINRYISSPLLHHVKQGIMCMMGEMLQGLYHGPFGVDMMVVQGNDSHSYLLHPCVEINLRRTMGHVALSLPASELLPKRIMYIDHDVNYLLKIANVENCFVKTL